MTNTNLREQIDNKSLPRRINDETDFLWRKFGASTKLNDGNFSNGGKHH